MFATFVLVGPAIGSLAFGVLVTLTAMVTDPGVGFTFILASIAFIALAYVIGGLQAAFAGAVTALAVWRRGHAPLWVPMVAATLAWAYAYPPAEHEIGISAVMLAVHLMSAAGCWFTLRQILGWK